MLQFITHKNEFYDEYTGTEAVLEGGVRWVQLRMKDAPLAEVESMARRLVALCRRYGATFIVDDHIEVALAVGADGVHLGKNDASPVEARQRLGAAAIVGGTANTFEDVERLCSMGVDYIGLGPYRFTQTKCNLSAVLGLEGYRSIAEQMRLCGLSTPVVAIGGITAEDVQPILECGVEGIALSGGLISGGKAREESARMVALCHGRENNVK